MTGVYGVKFTTVFTLQVAASAFHQGILALAWQYGKSAALTRFWSRITNAFAVTNLPHVRLDMSVDTMVQLRIPYLAVTDFSPIYSTDNYGALSLTNLTACPVPTGGSAASYKLYVHFEDMEFLGATADGTTLVATQSGRKLKPINEEFENDAYPMSSGLHAGSRVFKFISKGIPMLSSLADPPAWFLDKAAGVARSFGFAKPSIQDPIMRINRVMNIGETNVDVPSSTVTVGPFASNGLKVDSSVANSNVDEMSMSYVLSQWSQICYGTMTTSLTTGSILYLTNVSPSAFWYREPAAAPFANLPPPLQSGAGANSLFPSHLFFWSQMFRYWRGSIRFRFTFAKTKMHGGRVMVAYVPQRDTLIPWTATPLGSVPTPTLSSGLPQPFTTSAIFDLRDGNVFTFDVPYTSDLVNMPWLDSTGGLTMFIVDPLQTTTTIAPSINFIVEVCGMPDFELSDPIGPRLAAHFSGTPRVQAGRNLAIYSPDASQTTIGESIASAKQLISIPKASPFLSVASVGTVDMSVMPWYYQRASASATPGPLVMQPEIFGFGGNIATCYTFCRGGTDVHIYGDTKLTLMAYVDTIDASATIPAATKGSWVNSPKTSTPIVVNSSELGAHIRYPAYQVTPRFYSFALNTANWSPATNGPTDVSALSVGQAAPLAIPRLASLTPTTDSDTCIITRAAGEDALLGHYIGPVPLVLPSVATNNYYDKDTLDLFLTAP